MPDFFIDPLLRLQTVNLVDVIDLLLATALVFLVVTLLQRTQAPILVRGVTAVALVLVTVSLLLPLPTFRLLVSGILIFLLIASPVVFQRELRRLLEDIGRRIGIAPSVRRETEELMQPLVRAVERMAAACTGALIALEGEVDLTEVAETGVPVYGRVTSELLQSIFHGKNPLHDGAVIIRGQEVLAAATLLPVAHGSVHPTRRVGTRHRAAVGLSRVTDALVIVVSEERGTISVVEGGQLQILEDSTALRERLVHFARRTAHVPESTPFLGTLYDSETGRIRPRAARRARRVAARFILALLLGASLWWYELSTGEPLPQVSVTGVPLDVQDRPADLAVVGELPQTVNLTARTVAGGEAILDERAFSASLSLSDLSPGLREVAVQVTPRLDAPVNVVAVEPASVVVALAPLLTRTVSITVALPDEAFLPPSYAIQDGPQVEPARAEVSGPEPLVSQVVAVRATLSLSNTTAPVEAQTVLTAVDSRGDPVEGVTIRPPLAEVMLDVGRRADVREVGIAIVTEGDPAPGYWVSGLAVEPSTLVLRGPPAILGALGNVVPTQPVEIAGAAGSVEAQVPLDLPRDAAAETLAGAPLRSVRVQVTVSPRRGNLMLTRPVQIAESVDANGLTVTPAEVELLITGPLATLQAVEENPDLVQVILEGVDIASGESDELVPTLVAPEELVVQVVPPRINVTRQ